MLNGNSSYAVVIENWVQVNIVKKRMGDANGESKGGSWAAPTT